MPTSVMSTFGERFEPWSLPTIPGETADQSERRRNSAYFDWQLNEIVPQWHAKFPPIDFAGKSVLDLGCGHGALATDLILRGAAKVVGVDLDAGRVDFGTHYINDRFADVSRQILLQCCDISTLSGSFDIVISKDTFEHIRDLPVTVGHIYRLLKPGGLLVVGTAPLYYSPYGDHGVFWGSRSVPWLPVFLPEKYLLTLARSRRLTTAISVDELGLNKLTPSGFRGLFSSSSWTITSLSYNVGQKRLLSILRVLRVIPFVERFFTVSIYSIIAKVGSGDVADHHPVIGPVVER